MNTSNTQNNDGNVNTSNTQNNDGKVYTQEQINSFINEGFKKGSNKAATTLLSELGLDSVETLKTIVTTHVQTQEANKTELQKAHDVINDLKNQVSTLTNTMSQTQKDAKVNRLALDNGITEIDYFKYEYEKASSVEGFDEANFIKNLLESKGAILKGSVANNTQNKNVNNPKNQQERNDIDGEKITMSAYSMLSKEEQTKYKSNQIVRG